MEFNLTKEQIIDLLNGITIKVYEPKTSETYLLTLEKCIQSDEKLHSESGQAIGHFKLNTGETVCVLNG